MTPHRELKWEMSAEAFGLSAEPSWTGIGRGAFEKETPQTKYEEAKPSVAEPSKENEVSSQARLLGY